MSESSSFNFDNDSDFEKHTESLQLLSTSENNSDDDSGSKLSIEEQGEIILPNKKALNKPSADPNKDTKKAVVQQIKQSTKPEVKAAPVTSKKEEIKNDHVLHNNTSSVKKEQVPEPKKEDKKDVTKKEQKEEKKSVIKNEVVKTDEKKNTKKELKKEVPQKEDLIKETKNQKEPNGEKKEMTKEVKKEQKVESKKEPVKKEEPKNPKDKKETKESKGELGKEKEGLYSIRLTAIPGLTVIGAELDDLPQDAILGIATMLYAILREDLEKY